IELSKFISIKNGKSNRDDSIENGTYPLYVRSKDILRTNKWEMDNEAVLIPGEGGIGTIFHYVNGKYALHQRVFSVSSNDTNVLRNKYIYYNLKAFFTDYLKSTIFNGTVSSLRKPMISEYPIKVPSIEIQDYIINILDKLYELYENNSGSLSQELQLRKKQTKYYMNKLLTFKKLEK
ncbi:restriction endonuclease subunit S, partial [Mycoplasmopsis verecunda]